MPVYLAGARMIDYYPVSIVVHGVALNITVQSHVDQLCFGLIACRRAVADVHDLADQMQRALDVLRAMPVPAAKAEPVPALQAAPPRRAAKKAAPVARKVATARARREDGERRPPRERRRRGDAAGRAAEPVRRVARAKPRLAVVATAAKPRRPRAAVPARWRTEGRAHADAREVAVTLIALLHVYFLVLEMFLWTTPLGRRRVRQQRREGRDHEGPRRQPGALQRVPRRRPVLGPQRSARAAITIKVFFLGCVIVAGIYGGITASRKILLIQALPAAIALALVLAVS